MKLSIKLNIGAPRSLGASKAKREPNKGRAVKYPDELVAHVKWSLKFSGIADVACQYNLPYMYVKNINDGIVRANVQPKEPTP